MGRTRPFATQEDFDYVDKKMGMFDKTLPEGFNVINKKLK